MERENDYPQHLYESIRIDVAKSYFKREFRKYLSNTRGPIWESIDSDVDSWFEPSSPVGGPRDFWNGFWGVAMGFKLKKGLLQVLTAENIQWEEVSELPLDEGISSGTLGYIDLSLNRHRLRASELREFAQNPENKTTINKWKQIFEEQARASEERDQFPIIAEEEIDHGQTILSIYDGNRRFAKAIFSGKSTINAYVGKYKTPNKVPRNFWLPTSYLMEMIRETEALGTEESYQQTLSLLREYKTLSESGRYELLNRVLVGSSDFIKRIKEELENTRE